jgi:ORF6N domain
MDSLKQQIFIARGQRVALDHDLARLYGVTTKHLNEQLRRNRNRFPKWFLVVKDDSQQNCFVKMTTR